MKENQFFDIQPNTENLGNVLFELKSFLKSLMKESIEEVLGNQLSEQTYRNQTITSDELCSRWKINKNTLRLREIDGVISPLSVSGRTKVYSMNDVREVELSGKYKRKVG